MFPAAGNGIVSRDDSAVTLCIAVFLLCETLALSAADVIRQVSIFGEGLQLTFHLGQNGPARY